ncbi:MAG: thioredoxin domain-containing protein [Patescibacteria group bacterium]
MNKRHLVIILVVAAAVLGIAQYLSRSDQQSTTALAQCLVGRGAIMYGAQWCSHCQNQKNMFGDAFSLMQYVECTQDPAVCLAAGVQGYPTWIFPDGRRLEGKQSLESLAQAGGCPMPVSQ